jgi:hypothetical protein
MRSMAVVAALAHIRARESTDQPAQPRPQLAAHGARALAVDGDDELLPLEVAPEVHRLEQQQPGAGQHHRAPAAAQVDAAARQADRIAVELVLGEERPQKLGNIEVAVVERYREAALRHCRRGRRRFLGAWHRGPEGHDQHGRHEAG